MTSKELHCLIGRCLALDENPPKKRELEQLFQSQEINWERFVWTCSNHLVLQTIYVKFRDHGLLESIPQQLSDYLREIYELNLARNQEIIIQVKALNAALNKSNIRPIYLKGVGNLLDNLYSDPGERIMADIDLLLPEKDFLAGVDIIKKLGYSSPGELYEELTEIMHYPSLHKEGMPADVEIHRSPVMLRWSRGLNEEMVSGEKKEVHGFGDCYVLSDAHKVILNFIHGQLSNEGSISGRVSFRDMYDLYLLSRRVDVSDVLNGIPYKQRAVSYMLLVSEYFPEKKELQHSKTASSGLYLFHYHMCLFSRVYSRGFNFTRNLLLLIFVRYLWKIPAVIFSKKTRKTVFRKLGSGKWYNSHFSSFKERFR